MRVKASDIAISTIGAVLAAALVSLLYSLDWYWILGLAVVFDLLILFLLQNQSKNYRKWSKHPTTFPNPSGGGILGQYQLRPWQNELKDMSHRTETKGEEREIRKLDRISRKKARRRMRQLQKSRSP